MKFSPKSKEEAMMAGLLPKGNYPFLVKNATEEISQKGNPMVKLVLCVWDEKGLEHIIYDYLMELIAYKLHHFCYAIGLGDMSANGEFDCQKVIGQQGVCRIYIKEGKEGKHPPQNAIADYVMTLDKNKNEVRNINEPKLESFESDDVPF